MKKTPSTKAPSDIIEAKVYSGLVLYALSFMYRAEKILKNKKVNIKFISWEEVELLDTKGKLLCKATLVA
jgi:hypothetical protein